MTTTPAPAPPKRRLPRIRKVLRPLRPRLIRVRALALWGFGYALTALLPPRTDRFASGLIARIYLSAQPSYVALLAYQMQELLAPRGIEADWDRLARDNITMGVEEDLGRIRSLHRRGWQPSIDVVGYHHLEEALAAGRGAVLWRMSSGSSPVANHAMAARGHPLVHLSSPTHGCSRWHGPFWGKHIPRWYAVAENRHLRERVLLSKRGNFEYLRVLLAHLDNNEVISIFGDTVEGRQNVEAEVLGGPAVFATGAPAIARKSGCTLLTVYTRYVAPQRYQIVIDPPVPVDRTQSRDRVVTAAIEEFAHRLEDHILECPASWRHWRAARRGPLA